MSGSLRVLAWPAWANADNPYHARLYAPMADLGITIQEYSPAALASDGWDVLHVHWPEFLLGRRGLPGAAPAVAAFAARVARARAQGRRVVWTVHNLAPHDRVVGGRIVYRLVSRLADAVICHDESSLAAARARYPALRRRPAAIVPQGHYRGAYPRTRTVEESRASLGLGPADRVALCFGSIRPYKRVGALLDAFARTPGDDLRLVVAGRPAPELGETIAGAAAADRRVVAHLDFVADADVERYFGAADVVVLPHHGGVLESAVALLGLSFDRPILGPDTAALRELRRTVGPAWVRTLDRLDPDHLGPALHAVLPDGDRAPLDHLDWSVLATRTADLYRSVAARSGDRQSLA